MTISRINQLKAKIAECEHIISIEERDLNDPKSRCIKSKVRANIKKYSQRADELRKEIEGIENSETHKHMLESFKVFESFIEELVEEWVSWAIHKRNTIEATEERLYNEALEDGIPQHRARSEAYREVIQMFGERDYYEHFRVSDEVFRRCYKADAIALVENLIARVENKVGIVKDYSGLRVSFKDGILNGTVVGEKGVVTVRSIWAGGYNIQRLHIRVLVK